MFGRLINFNFITFARFLQSLIVLVRFLCGGKKFEAVLTMEWKAMRQTTLGVEMRIVSIEVNSLKLE